jgi:hypothetical protein
MKTIYTCILFCILKSSYQISSLKNSNSVSVSTVAPTKIPNPSNKKPKPNLQVAEEFNLSKCDPEILSQFLAEPSLKNFIKDDPTVLNICPSLSESCCSGDELYQFSEILKTKGNSLNKMIDDMGKLIQIIVDLGEEGIKKLRNLASIGNCTPTEENTLDQAYKYIFVYSEKILRDTHTAVNFSRSRTSSLICEICTTRAVNFLNIKPKETHLIVSNNYCKRFFTTTEGMMYFRLFHHLSYFEPFITSVSCLFHKKLEMRPFLGSQNWNLQMKTYVDCMNSYEKTRIVDFKHCIFQCKTYNPLNDNIFRRIAPVISSIVPMFNELLASKEYIHCPSILSKKSISAINHTDCVFSTKLSQMTKNEIESIGIFSYYITGIIKDKKTSIFMVNWLISNKDGLDPDVNKFVYFESVLAFGVHFISLLVFMFLD